MMRDIRKIIADSQSGSSTKSNSKINLERRFKTLVYLLRGIADTLETTPMGAYYANVSGCIANVPPKRIIKDLEIFDAE